MFHYNCVKKQLMIKKIQDNSFIFCDIWRVLFFRLSDNSSHTSLQSPYFAILILSSLHLDRCGRTDKGVSAFDQVISITLRSRLRKGIGVEEPCLGEPHSTTDRLEEHAEEAEEINYVQLLNRG